MPEAIVHSLLTVSFMRLGDGSVVIHRDGVMESRVQLKILLFEGNKLVRSSIEIQRADRVPQYSIAFGERIGIRKDGIALFRDGNGGP